MTKLSDIANATGTPAPTDKVVGVTGGATDNLFSLTQIANSIGNIGSIPLSQITASPGNPAFTDVMVGISSPSTAPVDYLFTIAQIGNTLGIIDNFSYNNTIDLGGFFGSGSVPNITFNLNGGFGHGGDVALISQGIFNSLDLLFLGQPSNGATIFESSTDIYLGTAAVHDIWLYVNRNNNYKAVGHITSATSFILQASGALATNATDGFTYIPTCAGTPTGTPTTQTGAVAMVYDTTDNKFYIYNGGWKGGTTPGAFT